MQIPNPAGNATVSLNPFYLDVGMAYVLVITNTSQNCTLEFRHGPSDTTWHTYPNLAGTQVSGVIVLPFTCISGSMQVKFAAGPAAEQTLSAIAIVQSAF